MCVGRYQYVRVVIVVNCGANVFALVFLSPYASQGLVYEHSAGRCRWLAISRAENAEVRSLARAVSWLTPCRRLVSCRLGTTFINSTEGRNLVIFSFDFFSNNIGLYKQNTSPAQLAQ